MSFQGKHAAKTFLPVLVILLVVGLLFAFIGIDLLANNAAKEPDVFVGVDVGFGDENDVCRVADAVQGYANLIIIGSSSVTTQTENLTRVCNYLYQRGFSFIVYVGFGKGDYYPPQGPEQLFFNTTVKQWGEKFLGAYIFDEIGGKQMDYPLTNFDKPVKNASSFSDAAQQYVHILNGALANYTGPNYYDAPNLKVFTSDYTLYWFDYLFGYNVVLGEFVGNHSRQLAVALCRGAANTQRMDWGTMITWKFNQAPFLEEGGQLYDDMVLAYENGAKYIAVFDGFDNQTSTTELGILAPEHLNAMKQFWDYALAHPRIQGDLAETAYVLPRDYGFGFRGSNDSIWGLPWPEDTLTLSTKIWNDTNNLISTYGTKIDIVYETLSDDVPIRLPYDRLIFWNGTTIGKP